MALATVRHRADYPPASEGVAGVVRIQGRFTTAGASSPTVKSNGPWSVSRTAQGTLKVTFTEMFTEVLAIHVAMSQATGGNDLAFEVTGSATAGSSPNTPASFSIETQSVAGTNADLTGPIVSFTAEFRKGALTR